jgi:diguanylate cyclase (GGDEF)-like protein
MRILPPDPQPTAPLRAAAAALSRQLANGGRPAKWGTARGIAQASIPVAAVGLMLLLGSAAGLLGHGPYAVLAAVLAIAVAVAAGLRERWILMAQGRLRGALDAGQVELERSERRLVTVLESTNDSVLVVDPDWNIVYFNGNAAATINNRDLLRVGVCIWDLFPAAHSSGEAAHYYEAVRTGKPAEFELFVDDRKLWLDIHAYPSPEGLSIFFRDISEEKSARDVVLNLAWHDPLTGLANRTLFQSRLRDLTSAGTRFAVILIDIDHFKEVNDTLGHPLGDLLLKGMADRLNQCVRSGDLVARLGGDEFVIIAEGADATEAGKLAQRFADAASTPLSIEGELVRLGASIGIALADGADKDPDRVFRNADIALYAAKADTRGSYRVFEPAMEAGLQERQSLRADLRVALENGELELQYQPLVDLRSEQVSSFEALLRWRHPVRGLVLPEVFIPIAEESGLIVAIGDWVLNTACKEAAKWPDAISVAVNFSTREFANGDLADNVARALGRSGLPARRLEAEITESVLLKKSRHNLDMLHRLRELGVRIALDDFGTGYSSLSYLQQFPFSKIKIDRSFITGLPLSEPSQAIVRSVIGLGIALGMRVTAEGVETAAQYEWVRLGCNEAQGYYLSPAVTPAEVPDVIERLNARARGGDIVRRTRGAA